MPESDLLPDFPDRPSYVSLRDRLAGWAETLDLSLSRLVLGAVVTLVLGIAAWRLLAPAEAPPEMELPMVTGGSEVAAAAVTEEAPPAADGDSAAGGAGSPGPDGATAPSADADAEGREVVVHIAGAVQAPGVQRMSPSARVVDAVEAAGGATPDAELARINLAAAVEDGQQIYVPAVGEEPPEPVTGGAGGGTEAGTAGNAAGDGAAASVDVNTAAVDELEALPGIGPAIGQAIVDHREQHGPFTSVDQLTDVRGIGDAKLEGLRDHATV